MSLPQTERGRFTHDQLVAEAVEATGVDDFGAPGWEEGLDLLLDSLVDTAQLNDVGVMVVGDGIVANLSNRLLLEQWRKDHPLVQQQRVERPVVIVGQPRPAPRCCTT